MINLKGERIFAYARYSSDRQSESSIEDQIRRINAELAPVGKKVGSEQILTDYAISGASTHRPGFEELMRKVRSREIDVLLVESTSRLSRDQADAAALYKELAYYGVQLVAIADGLDTSTRGAKAHYSLKALMDDMYLDGLRDMTLRGMEGRALAGYSTGGLPYGYRSVPVPGPDPRSPAGYKIEVEMERAKIVIWTFEQYAAGRSYDAIAKELNAKGVPPPRAGSRHRRQGWVGSTVRAILHNAKYAGIWTFNERQWIKVPGTNVRRPRKKDPKEVLRQERPELRIVSEDLWATVQQRLAAVRIHYAGTDDQRKGRSAGARANYLLSGLLFCGACGASMVISGGSSSRQYRCNDNKNRGTCKNRLGVREDVARTLILQALRDQLCSPAELDHVRRQVAHELGKLSRGRDQELAERTDRLARTEARIANIVEFIAKGESSEALANALRDLEAQARAERVAIDELERLVALPIRLPSPKEVGRLSFEMCDRLQQDPLAGREELRRYLEDERIVLEPQPDGTYIARCKYLPLVMLAATGIPLPPRKSSGAVVNTLRSGGRI